MTDQSPMYSQMILEGFGDAIFLPESADGTMPSNSPDGPQTGPSGRVPVPASRSAKPGSKKALTIPGIFGRDGYGSLESAALQTSLANKLRQQLGMDGSILWQQTLKNKITPLGRPYLAHTARVRSTSATAFISWPTATANDATGSQYAYSRGNHDKPVLKLPGAVQLSAWPTTTVSGNNDHTQAQRKTRQGSPNLENAAQFAAWSTASSRDWKDTFNMSIHAINPDGTERIRLDMLPRQATLTLGMMQNGCFAQTANTGQLNPAFSRWLMGYPEAWCIAAIHAHRNKPTKRRKRGKLA